MKNYFVYGYDLKTAIGGVKNTAVHLPNIININYKSQPDLPDIDVGDKIFLTHPEQMGYYIKAYPKNEIFLICHLAIYNYFHNFPNSDRGIKSWVAPMIERIRCSPSNFRLVCITVNDYHLAVSMFGENKVILGRNPIITNLPKTDNIVKKDRPLISLISRLEYAKNVEDFAKLSRITPQYDFFYTDFVDANDEDSQFYSDYLKEKKLDLINMYWVHPSQVEYLWERTDVLVCTSRYECSPLVYFEALWRGIPVVTYDLKVPDYEYFKDVIFTVPHSYIYDLKNQITKVIGLKYDEGFRALCRTRLEEYYLTVPSWGELLNE